MALRKIAGKLLLLPVAIENWIVLSVGVAGAMAWLTGGLLEPGSSDPWGIFLIAFLTLFRRLTFSFLILGGIAWFLRWMRSRVLTSPLGTRGENQPWIFVAITILVVHGALVVVLAEPLPRLLQDTIQLLERMGTLEGLRRGGEFSGIYLVPLLGILMAPGMAMMTAFSFFVGAVVTLGYLLLGLENISRVLLRSICLQIAFLLGFLFTLDLFEAGIRFVEGGLTEQFASEKTQILSWLTGQVNSFSPLVWHFAWLLPGFFICAAIMIQKARHRLLQDTKETIDTIPEQSSMQLQERMPTHSHQEASMAETIPGGYADRFVETDVRFKHKSYLIKYKFFSNPFYKDFDVYDSGNSLIFTARMSGFNFITRDITVYEAGSERSNMLLISGKRLIRFPNYFHMSYVSTGKKIGTFKNSPAGWAILDEYGRHIAIMNREEDPSGSMKHQIMMGSTLVCEYRFQSIIRPVIMIDFPDASESIFDRKLGIGLALVLGYQEVAFNYTYSSN